jgi:hypothetical protein
MHQQFHSDLVTVTKVTPYVSTVASAFYDSDLPSVRQVNLHTYFFCVLTTPSMYLWAPGFQFPIMTVGAYEIVQPINGP